VAALSPRRRNEAWAQVFPCLYGDQGSEDKILRGFWEAASPYLADGVVREAAAADLFDTLRAYVENARKNLSASASG
jgi:hypothetical protein